MHTSYKVREETKWMITGKKRTFKDIEDNKECKLENFNSKWLKTDEKSLFVVLDEAKSSSESIKLKTVSKMWEWVAWVN